MAQPWSSRPPTLTNHDVVRPTIADMALNRWSGIPATMEPMKRRPWNDQAWSAPRRVLGRGGATSVKLMPDYACELPLWKVDWWEPSLSNSLLNDLADWQQGFDEGFDERKGWRSDPTAKTWANDAENLVARMRDELDGRFGLEVDLWPLDGAD